MSDLTDKQKRFVDEYLVDMNATQAAIRAGYSEKTAMEQGYQLLQKTSVQAEIQKRMNDRSERTEITQDMVLKEYAKIGFAKITDVLSYKTEKVVVGYDDGEPVWEYKQVIDLKDSDQIDGSLIQEIRQTKDGLVVKLHDKKGALDSIGKHLGMFKEKIEHSTEDGKPLQVLFNISRPQRETKD